MVNRAGEKDTFFLSEPARYSTIKQGKEKAKKQQCSSGEVSCHVMAGIYQRFSFRQRSDNDALSEEPESFDDSACQPCIADEFGLSLL